MFSRSLPLSPPPVTHISHTSLTPVGCLKKIFFFFAFYLSNLGLKENLEFPEMNVWWTHSYSNDWIRNYQGSRSSNKMQKSTGRKCFLYLQFLSTEFKISFRNVKFQIIFNQSIYIFTKLIFPFNFFIKFSWCSKASPTRFTLKGISLVYASLNCSFHLPLK